VTRQLCHRPCPSFPTRRSSDLSGKFGPGGSMRLLIEGHEMKSDGYQTFNVQDRKAFSAKFQYSISDQTTLTAVSSVMQLNANTRSEEHTLNSSHQIISYAVFCL